MQLSFIYTQFSKECFGDRLPHSANKAFLRAAFSTHCVAMKGIFFDNELVHTECHLYKQRGGMKHHLLKHTDNKINKLKQAFQELLNVHHLQNSP